MAMSTTIRKSSRLVLRFQKQKRTVNKNVKGKLSVVLPYNLECLLKVYLRICRILSTRFSHCLPHLYFLLYDFRRERAFFNRSFLGVSLTCLMASAHFSGSSEHTTHEDSNCTLPNPELLLTKIGRPAESASRAVRPKPSVREGIMARSTSQKSLFTSSRLAQ